MYTVYAMQDGRAFTNFKPAAQLDYEIQMKQGITSQKEFNEYLKANGEKIRKSNGDFSLECKCKNCILKKD